MKSLIRLRTLILVGIVVTAFNGAGLLACIGLATSCGETCDAIAPTGGTAQCIDGINFAECISYDGNGNIVSQKNAYCAPTPPNPNDC